MPDETKGAFTCTSREVKVARVVASTTVVDMDYSRVELEIDGELYEFSGPDAQVVGAHLNTAGGGDMFVKFKHDARLLNACRDVVGNYMGGSELAESIAELERLTGGQQNGS